jgi:hypothetical protein
MDKKQKARKRRKLDDDDNEVDAKAEELVSTESPCYTAFSVWKETDDCSRQKSRWTMISTMTMTKDQTIKIMMPITLTTVKGTMILEGKRVGH